MPYWGQLGSSSARAWIIETRRQKKRKKKENSWPTGRSQSFSVFALRILVSPFLSVRMWDWFEFMLSSDRDSGFFRHQTFSYQHIKYIRSFIDDIIYAHTRIWYHVFELRLRNHLVSKKKAYFPYCNLSFCKTHKKETSMRYVGKHKYATSRDCASCTHSISFDLTDSTNYTISILNTVMIDLFTK